MPAKRTAEHHSSDDSLLRKKARALSNTRPASTSAIHSQSWRSTNTTGGTLQVFCAGKTVQAPRESIKQLKASVDAVAARHGLGLNSEVGGLEREQSHVTRGSSSALVADQHPINPDSRKKRKVSAEFENEGSKTNIDAYGDSDGDMDENDMDENEVVMEDVYLVEKSCGCHHRDNFDEEMPVATPLKVFCQLKAANDYAKQYLRSGKYSRVPWEKLELETTGEMQVNVLAETLHHWYRIQVHKKQQQRLEPPFVYVVEETTRTHNLRSSKKEREDSDVISREGIFRDRSSANTFAGVYHKATTKERVKEGYVQGETMVRGLLTIADVNDGRKGEGNSVTVSVKKVPLL